jgi:hypothetical protein
MTRYAFMLSHLEIGETRGKQNTDDYLVTFSVTINDQVRGAGSGRFEVLARGATAYPPRPDRRERMTRGWVLGPFELEPDDHVVLTVSGTNIGDSEHRINQEESEKMQMKLLESVVSAGIGLFTGVIGAGVAGALSHFLTPVSKLLGWEAPERCNGLVFGEQIELTVPRVQRLNFSEDRPNTQVRVATIVRDYTDEATHDTEACGAIARTRVVMKVREEYGPVQVKIQAIAQNQSIDISQGLLQIAPTTEPVSLKQLLNLVS